MGQLTRTISPRTTAALVATPGTGQVTVTLPAHADALGTATRTLTRTPAFGAPVTLSATATTYTDLAVSSGQTYAYSYTVTDQRGLTSAASTASCTPVDPGTNAEFVGNMQALGVQGSTNGPTYVVGSVGNPVTPGVGKYATAQTYHTAYQLGYQPRPVPHPLGKNTTVSLHFNDYANRNGGTAPDGFDLGPAPRGSTSGTPPQIPADRCERRHMRVLEGNYPYDGRTIWAAHRFIMMKVDCAPDPNYAMCIQQWHYEPDSTMPDSTQYPANPPFAVYASFNGTIANPIVTLALALKFSASRPAYNNTVTSVASLPIGTVNLDHENDLLWAIAFGWNATGTNVGRTRCWFNGAAVIDRTGGNCYNQAKMTYPKNGLYGANWKFSNATTFPIVTRRKIYQDEDRQDWSGNGSFSIVDPVTYAGARM
jgi:hypothetical protein